LDVEKLTIEQLDYRYLGVDRPALRNISCSLGRNQIIGLVGLSASGKSTFGRLLKGLMEPSGGRIMLWTPDADNIQQQAADRLKLVGWVGPHPEVQIFAESVYEETAYGPVNQGLTGELLTERVNRALNSMGFEPQQVSERNPAELSGGEKRRIALAGVIAMHYPFYVFDEPTASLDYSGREAFRELVLKLKDEGCGIIWITHEIHLLQGIIDRFWGMEDGRLVLDTHADNVDMRNLGKRLTIGESILEDSSS